MIGKNAKTAQRVPKIRCDLVLSHRVQMPPVGQVTLMVNYILYIHQIKVWYMELICNFLRAVSRPLIVFGSGERHLHENDLNSFFLTKRNHLSKIVRGDGFSLHGVLRIKKRKLFNIRLYLKVCFCAKKVICPVFALLPEQKVIVRREPGPAAVVFDEVEKEGCTVCFVLQKVTNCRSFVLSKRKSIHIQMELVNGSLPGTLVFRTGHDIDIPVIFFKHEGVDHNTFRRTVIQCVYQFPVCCRQDAAMASHIIGSNPVLPV